MKSNKKEQSVAKKVAVRRKLTGVVVSNKMQKTIVVKIDSLKMHPIYKKLYLVSKKYKVHDEKGQYKAGDAVEIVECRPLSKEKRWRVINK